MSATQKTMLKKYGSELKLKKEREEEEAQKAQEELEQNKQKVDSNKRYILSSTNSNKTDSSEVNHKAEAEGVSHKNPKTQVVECKEVVESKEAHELKGPKEMAESRRLGRSKLPLSVRFHLNMQKEEERTTKQFKEEAERLEWGPKRDNENFLRFSDSYTQTFLKTFKECKNLVEEFSLSNSIMKGVATTVGAAVGTRLALSLTPTGNSKQDNVSLGVGFVTGLYQIYKISGEKEQAECAKRLLDCIQAVPKKELAESGLSAEEFFAETLATRLQIRFAALLSELSNHSVLKLSHFFIGYLIDYIMFQKGEPLELMKEDFDCDLLIPKSKSSFYQEKLLLFTKNINLFSKEGEEWTIEGAIKRAPICMPNGAIYSKQNKVIKEKAEENDQTGKYPFIYLARELDRIRGGYVAQFKASAELIETHSKPYVECTKEKWESLQNTDAKEKSIREALDKYFVDRKKNSKTIALLKLLENYSQLETSFSVQKYCESSFSLTLKKELPMHDGHYFELLKGKINIMSQGLAEMEQANISGDEANKLKTQIKENIELLTHIFLSATAVLKKKQDNLNNEVEKLRNEEDRANVDVVQNRHLGQVIWDGTCYVVTETVDVFVCETFRDIKQFVLDPVTTIANIGQGLWTFCKYPEQVGKELWKQCKDQKFRTGLQIAKMACLASVTKLSVPKKISDSAKFQSIVNSTKPILTAFNKSHPILSKAAVGTGKVYLNVARGSAMAKPVTDPMNKTQAKKV